MAAKMLKPMKLNAISILRETLIVLSLAMFSTMFVLAIGIMSKTVTLDPLLRLGALGLVYLAVSCGVMLIFGVRKLWVLLIRAVVSGVIAAVLIVAAAVSRYTYVLVPAKVVFGEGGVVHKVGEALMHSPGCTNTYSVYWGDVKYANRSDMRELILLADAPVKSGQGIRSPILLVGKSRILLAHGFSGMRIFPAYAAVTCLGGIDITSDKVGVDARLSIADSGSSRIYRCEQREWDKMSGLQVPRTYYLNMPLSCFAEVGAGVSMAVSTEPHGNRNRVASVFSGVASHYAETRPNPTTLRRRR